MSNNEHPITPPDELVKQWQSSLDCPDNSCAQSKYIATQATRWGADQELDACEEWISFALGQATAANLRFARRPKPKSLKEQIAAAIRDGDERSALTLLDEALPE